MSSNNKENWVVVPGFPNYEVSDRGRVRRADTGRMLKTPPKNNGYLQVGLTNDGKTKNFSVHRLVARAFLPRITGKDLVLHKDGDRTNNHLENLYRGDYSDNHTDAVRHGTFVNGSKNGMAKLTEADVEEIRIRLDAGERQVGIAKDFGVTRSLISKIYKGDIWNG